MPARLARYLLRETAGLYLLGVAAFCLLLSIDLLSVLARFLIQQHATLGQVGSLLLFKLPYFLHLSLPIAVVFAVLLATGRLAKDSELKAAYSLGARPLELLLPVALLGALVGAVSFVNNGFLESRAEAAYQHMIDAFVYVRPPAQAQTNASFKIAGEGVFYAASVRGDLRDHRQASLQGILVLEDDGTVLTAPTGTWSSAARTWTLERAVRSASGSPPTSVGTVTLSFPLQATPSQTLARSDTLPLNELGRQIARLKQAGGNASQLLFQYHRRIADAFSALVFALFAGALGLRVRGRAAGFAWTIVLLVAFWALWLFSQNLYEAGALGPVAAAWLTPVASGMGATVLAVWRLGT
ncbi:MAG: LptF/LptG family permease [Deinococcales bacterium]